MAKTYDATDLEILCNADREQREKKTVRDEPIDDAIVSIGDLHGGFAYVFGHEGLFLWVDRGFIHELHDLPYKERSALLCGYSEVTLERGPRGFLVSPAPVLPFPFTARQLWELDRATGGTITDRFPYFPGEEGGVLTTARMNEEWLSKQPPNVQELARILLDREPPEAELEDSGKSEPAAHASTQMPMVTERRGVPPERNDLLRGLIVEAMTECGPDATPAQVFMLLRKWAQQEKKRSPLFDVDESYVKWLDGNDKVQDIDQKAVGQRMRRLRQAR